MVIARMNAVKNRAVDRHSKCLTRQPFNHNVQGFATSGNLKINDIRIHQAMPLKDVSWHDAIHKDNLVAYLHARF
jgi:hypothetical protein